MQNGYAAPARRAGIWGDLVWGVGAAVASFVTVQICILVGAVFALAAESGASRTVGQVVNAIAFGFMILAYAVILSLAMRYLARRGLIRPALWVGLLVFPLTWTVLILLTRDGRFGTAPLVVSLAGAAAAWLVAGRSNPSREEPSA
ncbi:MAG TPA: hypothetical protein VFG89_06840 [Coriobacteriia bacterium]|nr:hypothetical protein [Coriobacteriia bacterium]